MAPPGHQLGRILPGQRQLGGGPQRSLHHDAISRRQNSLPCQHFLKTFQDLQGSKGLHDHVVTMEGAADIVFQIFSSMISHLENG